MTAGTWTRRTPLNPAGAPDVSEVWEYDSGGVTLRFDMDIRVGKPLDVVGLKGIDFGELRTYASYLAEAARRLYSEPSALSEIARCPACGNEEQGPSVALEVFDVAYVSCSACAHGYVRRQPRQEALHELFTESAEHSAVYVDPEALEIRMREVVAPKVDWVLDVFSARTGGRPSLVVDVGAGGGHFVAAVQARGIDAIGFEPSRASRAFADEAFGLALRTDDFREADLSDVDVVTFWGMLEYAPEPKPFLDAARRLMRDDSGLVVAEVPRLHSLGTAVQAVEDAVVARHMDPTSHVNCFSDASIATLLFDAGFAPTAAWYFGMDAYETVIQAALRSADPDATFASLVALIQPLQRVCDAGRVADDLVLAATVR